MRWLKKLFRLVLDIEQAATEAAVAELLDDLLMTPACVKRRRGSSLKARRGCGGP
jgi:hypothetical protein